MNRFALFGFIAALLAMPTSVSALSCVQEDLEEKFERAAIVAVIEPEELLITDRSDSLASKFTWEVDILGTYKGAFTNFADSDVRRHAIVSDSVWPGTPETQSRLEEDKEFLVFLDKDAHLGLCDYPQNLNERPLSQSEKDELNKLSEEENDLCEPYRCNDGQTFPACDDGHVIHYLVHPCHEDEVEPPLPPLPPENPYGLKDIDGHRYELEIEWAIETGVAEGYDTGLFRPDALINRAEYAKVASITINGGLPTLGAHACFSDISGTEWFAAMVCYLKGNHTVFGYQDGTFRPADKITYAEAASMTTRLFTSVSRLPEPVNNWYDPYIGFLEFYKAVPPTVTRPHQWVTRGEVIYMLHTLNEARQTNRNMPWL